MICAYCKDEMTWERGYDNSATLDHIIPLSRGGQNQPANKLRVCQECNYDKGHLTIGEYMAILDYRHTTQQPLRPRRRFRKNPEGRPHRHHTNSRDVTQRATQGLRHKSIEGAHWEHRQEEPPDPDKPRWRTQSG